MQNSLLKTYHRNIIGTLLTMLCISVVIIVCLSVYAIDYTAKNEKNDLSEILNAEAQNKASSIMLWLDNIKNETNKFTTQNIIQAYYASFSDYQDKENKDLSHKELEDISQDNDVNEENQNIEDIVLRFITKQGFTNAAVYDKEKVLYTSQNLPTLSQEQNVLLSNAFELEKGIFSPIYQSEQGLIISLAYPIFAPEQTLDQTSDQTSDQVSDQASGQTSEKEKGIPIAVLLLDIPVKNKLTELLITTKQEIPSTNRLMQWTNETVQDIDLRNNSVYSITGWQTPKDTALPFMERQNQLGNAVYSLGIPINDYNLLMVYEVPAYFVKDLYNEFSSNIILMSEVGIGIVVLIILFSWYFLIVLNRKKLEKKMLKLYNDINTKEQLLNSVNSTLQDGLVFTDNLGNIQYANTGFANMIHHSADSLMGFKMMNFLHPDVAECLQRQIDKVVKSKSTYIFEEKFTIRNKTLYLQSMCTPYFGMQNEVIGVVSIYRDMTDISLEREAEQKRIEQLIQCFTRAIELLNPYLCGHSLALGTLALSLAKNLNCSLQEEKTIHLAASLSQIGMIGLPQELLNKKEQLTDKERELLYTHTTRSVNILKDFDFGLPVQIAIEQMNENMDGSGYPKGLHGEEINFLSRILNISNAFCAMLRPRIYRNPKTIDETLNILDSNKDKYDSRILNALYAYIVTEEGKDFVKNLQN